MDIPPDQEKNLESVYGKGAKMLLKMGLQSKHLENEPLESPRTRGRQGIGFLAGENPFKIRDSAEQNPKPGPSPRFPGIKKTRKGQRLRSPSSLKDDKFGANLSRKTADERRPTPQNELIEAFGNLAIVTDSEENVTQEFECIVDNIKLITDHCEEEIRKNADEIHDSSEELVILKKMETDICRRIDGQQKFIEDLEKLKDIISLGVEDANGDNEKRLDDYYRVFQAIKDNDFVWKRLEFYRYIAPLIVPLIKSEIGPTWNPLKHPILPAQLYVQWNDLLRDKPEEFEIILRETYLTPLEKSIKKWDGLNPQLVISIINLWSPTFPLSMINDIREEVWPKFNAVISNWDPSDQSDSSIVTPNWLHRWKKLFDTKFHVAVQKVCDKIEMTLGKWHPSESWAMETILEWQYLFNDRQMNQIVHRVVIVLENSLKIIKLDPTNRDTEAVDAALLWSEFLSPRKVCKILEKAFYPNWLQFIEKWLNSDVDLEEVSNWYIFWKSRMPTEIWEISGTHEHFKKALELINSAVEAQKIIYDTAALSLLDSPSQYTSYRPKGSKEDRYLLDANKFLNSNPTTFRDLLQKKCADNGIIFFAMGKNKDGKQVYRCKKDSIYIDDGVIYIKRDVWLPISMNDLLDL